MHIIFNLIYHILYLHYKEEHGKKLKTSKDLIQKILAYDTEHRLTVQEIKDHPWMKGRVASRAEIFQEMIDRYNAEADQDEPDPSKPDKPKSDKPPPKR